MKLKNGMAVMLVGALAINCLTGCGKGKESETETNSRTEGTSSAAGQDTDERPLEGNRYTDGCLPLVKEKETIKIAMVGEDDPNTHTMVQELEERTNVHVEWDYYPSISWQEKKNLMFVSGDLPDAILGRWCLTAQEMTSYGAQGLLIPLNDYINEETMPYLYAGMQEDYSIMAQAMMADGKIYSFPGYDFGPNAVSVSNPLYINQTWLDNLGLETPNTMEEFYSVLKEFKEKDANGNGDKNDEIPYTFVGNNYDMFASFGTCENGNHLAERDGQVYCTSMTQEYKEAVQFFRKLYEEGLIDQEAFTQDNAMFSAKNKAGEDGSSPRIVGAFQAWRTNRAPDYAALAPLESSDGGRAWPLRALSIVKENMVITKNAKNPELVAAWANQCYEPDYSLQCSIGYRIGVHMTEKDGKFEFVKVPDLSKEPDKSMFGVGPLGVTKSNGDRMFIPPHIQEKREIDEIYRPYLLDENIPNVGFTEEEAQQIADYTVDIKSYIEKMYAKWVMNGGIEEEWDEYIKSLENMGVTEWVGLYQTAVDRYNKVLEEHGN